MGVDYFGIRPSLPFAPKSVYWEKAGKRNARESNGKGK